MIASQAILVVDDDDAVGKVLVALLAQAGLGARYVASAAEALAQVAERPFDLVISDVRMPGMDGMALLRELAVRAPETRTILITAHGTVPLAVEAMRAGAADFILKPFDREELLFTVKKALAVSQVAAPSPPSGFAGRSASMAAAQALLKRAAASTATVLLRGESGTGKEVAAHFVHQESARHAGPFVKVHCAALPDALLESELFGYEKGAFTGAASRKPGRVALAQGGTLFLDEIGDIPLSTQVKLLRLLQDRAFEPLGSNKTQAADVRFVAATHQPLEARVKEGQFREDLYYRLNVVPVWLPPLRERPGDIEPLAVHFCAQVCAAQERSLTLDEGARSRLSREPWPGNVRQLQNFVERLVVLCDGPEITEGDVERELGRAGCLPAEETGPGEPSLQGRRREAERAALVEALSRARDNRTLAARLLGVSRRTLYNKLEEHGLL